MRSDRLAATVFFLALLLAWLTPVIGGAQPDASAGDGRGSLAGVDQIPLEFASFSKEGLENASKRWRELFLFFEREEQGSARLSYLIVPKHLVDTSVAPSKNDAVFGVFAGLQEEQDIPERGSVRFISSVPPDVLIALRAAYSTGILEDVYGQDVVAWNEAAINALLRISWLNRESPFDSAKLRALRRFRERLLIGEYGWLLSPKGFGRMVVISGLRGPSAAKVHTVIPSQGGSVSTFKVGGPDRAVLRDVVRVMEDEEIPISVTVSIAAVGIRPEEANSATLASYLEPRLIGSDGNVISGFYQMNVKEDHVHFLGFFLRNAVAPQELHIGLRPGSPYCLVQPGGANNGWRNPMRFPFPPGEPYLDSPPPHFALQLARLPSAARLSTADLWHHSVYFGEVWFARDTREIRRRHLEISARMPISVAPELLFADPQNYVGKLGSRTGRKVLGVGPRAQRVFAAEVRETNAALEALWSYIGIVRSQKQEPLEVMLIKYVPAPVRGFRKSLPGDRLICYVRCFLEHKIAAEGMPPVQLTEVEVPVHEAHATRSVGVVLVPRQGPLE